MGRKGSSGLNAGGGDYHRFPNFDGDPLSYSDREHERVLEKEDDWFRSNSNSGAWERDLTREEDTAIRMHVNGSRTLNSKYSEVLDNAVNKFNLNKGITVYRATDNFANAKVGDTIRESGHASTSVTNIGSWGRNTMLEIDVPSGKGRGIWIGKKGNATEHEFMLRRDASYKVKSRRVGKDGTVYLKVTME